MTDDPRDRNCLPPVCREVRFMTDDYREAGTVYPMFSVRSGGNSSFLSRIIRHVANLTENRG
jgi:hypothetical protein